MKLLFVHDVKAEVYGENVYARSYGYDIWKERYLPNFSEIKVCFRTKEVDKDLDGISDKSSGPHVVFDKQIGMFKGPDVFLCRRIKKILKNNVKNNDAVIVRLDSFLGLQTIRECRRLKKKYMIELVGCAWDSFWNHGLTGKLLAPYLFIRTKCEVRRAPFVVYVTSEFLQKRYPTKGVNTNISNVKLNKQNPKILEARLEKIEKMNKKIILGTAANVDVRYKGQQFVIEAATTSALGGIIGIGLGYIFSSIASSVIQVVLDAPLKVTPTAFSIMIAFSVSVGIGILFGFLPARKAARLNPIDALRYD